MANPGPRALSPEIDALRQQFEQIAGDADALVAPLDDAQFSWKPGRNAWSIGECLEHMNATARSYLPLLDEGIANAIRRGTYDEGPFEYNWLGRLVARVMESGSWLRVNAPPETQPGPARPKRETLAGFRAYQVQYIDRLRQANGIDLARARTRAPVLAWIPIPLGSAFALVAAHERRHLGQVRRVTETDGFPASA